MKTRHFNECLIFVSPFSFLNQFQKEVMSKKRDTTPQAETPEVANQEAAEIHQAETVTPETPQAETPKQPKLVLGIYSDSQDENLLKAFKKLQSLPVFAGNDEVEPKAYSMIEEGKYSIVVHGTKCGYKKVEV